MGSLIVWGNCQEVLEALLLFVAIGVHLHFFVGGGIGGYICGTRIQRSNGHNCRIFSIQLMMGITVWKDHDNWINGTKSWDAFPWGSLELNKRKGRMLQSVLHGA